MRKKEKQWEYRVLLVELMDPRISPQMNEYGSDGWEAYAVVKENTSAISNKVQVVVFFKRRK